MWRPLVEACKWNVCKGGIDHLFDPFAAEQTARSPGGTISNTCQTPHATRACRRRNVRCLRLSRCRIRLFRARFDQDLAEAVEHLEQGKQLRANCGQHRRDVVKILPLRDQDVYAEHEDRRPD